MLPWQRFRFLYWHGLTQTHHVSTRVLMFVISLEDCMQTGEKLVAAGYILYSSACVMVLSTGRGVHAFTLDPTFGEFVMTKVCTIRGCAGFYVLCGEGGFS